MQFPLLLLLELAPLCVSFAGSASHWNSLPMSSSRVVRRMMSTTRQRIPTREIDVDEIAADGRGVVIAVMDTGCDLAAHGMQVTTEGLPKYVDFVDCTGDGDVDMRTQKPIDGSGPSVVGVSGRTLHLPASLATVLEVRVGSVRLFDLLPKSALKRVQAERKTRYLETHHSRMARAQTQLDRLRRETTNENNNKTTHSTSLQKEISETELFLEQLQEMVKEYEDSGPIMDCLLWQQTDSDQNNTVWQALIDLNANGHLTQTTPMAPYAVHRQWDTFRFGSQVTFCVQVYEDGDVLSLVCDAGSHGTHVAGIAAAHFPDNPDANGVAPGAQILACKIGDVRLDSAETGLGLIRGLIAAKRHKCQLVNLSFGEPSWQPDRGRVAQVFDDAVHRWGMAVFTSAGNDGPALSSLGSPGDLSSLITVGAYVSRDMAVDQYSTLLVGNDDDDQQLPGASYSFSSRGPTPDGLLPDLCAPGGAIAPVPRHCLQGKGQKHGTSMASPSACGAAAVVLSALKAHGMDAIGPHELRRGLQNSAHPLSQDDTVVWDPLAQGAGLVSVRRAIDYIRNHHGKPGQDLFFDVKIPDANNARGIYIRDALQLAGPMTKTVSVKPRIEHSLEKTDKEMEAMLDLELELNLIPSQKWVLCPERLTLMSAKDSPAGQSFAIRLDPTQLPPGAHYATVDAIDSTDPERGPLFQVPITVIVPHAIVRTPPFAFAATGDATVPATQILAPDADTTQEITTSGNGIDVSMKYDLTPGSPSRRFLSVPASAEWATIKIRSTTPIAGSSAPHSLILHAIPFVRGDLHNKMVQLKRFFQLSEGVERTHRLSVRGLSTLEVCLQLSWLANPSPVSVVADVEFHSFDVRPPTLVASQPVRISGATEFARLGAAAAFRSEKIHPKATLTAVHRTVRPKEYKISVSSHDDRDILPRSDVEIKASISSMGAQGEEQPTAGGTLSYKCYLEYAFKLEDSKDDATISVTPRIASLFNQIYDSPVDSQLWMLQDGNGKLLGYGASMHEAAAVTLPTKGGVDYKLTLRISHPKRSVLEQMKDLPLRLAMKLSKELECPVYSEMDKASTPGVTDDGREQVKAKDLRRGAQCDLYVTRPTAKLPDWVKPGDTLFGSIKLNQGCEGSTVLDLVYEVPPKSDVSDGTKKKEEKKKDDSDDDKKIEEDLADTIFKTKISHLAKLRGKKEADAYKSLADQLKQEKGDSLPLLEELLTYAKETKAPENEANEKKWRALGVSAAVDAMKSTNGGPVDESALAQYFGCNNPPPEDEDGEAKEEADKIKKEMEERRKAWRSALLAKASAWAEVASSAKDEDASNKDDKTSFDEAVKELKQWVNGAGDLGNDKEKIQHAIVLSRHMKTVQGKAIGALATLRKARKDLPPGAYKELTEEMVKVVENGIDGMDYWLQQTEENLAERYPKTRERIL